MAEQAHCPTCNGAGLVHTGAFWICPSCGLMITKHALAAEIMRAARTDVPGEELTKPDTLPGPVKD